MLITNIEDVSGIKVFKCGKRLSEWLIKEKNISLLAIDKRGKYCFTDNDLLREILKQKPLFIFDIFK